MEGPDLIDAALRCGAALDEVFIEAGAPAQLAALAERANAAGALVRELAPGVLERVSDARAPQGICATCPPPLVAPALATGPGTVLVACDLADPGNLGTSIRVAHASGASGVVVLGAGVDVCNPKVLRATAGSIFGVAVAASRDLDQVDDLLRADGRRVVGAVTRGGVAPWAAALDGAAVLVGGEARGLPERVVDRCDVLVSIPMSGGAESLNAGVAAGVLMVEALRQRTEAGAAPGASPTI